MDIAEFNYAESLFWFIIALCLLVHAFKLGKSDANFRTSLIASIAFVAFGVSDIIEAQTGAWWRPFSLLVFKIGCIVAFLVCFIKYKKIESNRKT
ncbi:hypothetical protein P4S60_07230 [Pseudoalteromonas sp. Hal040]|uniref:hypothetical protein n=1 Tax=unclassified Pseudoalteromonas TaxID=194690 RepID=UPI00110A9F87|nr:hypothetical protein [Pseudoalteromonas sp. S4492]TMO27370.1 hypothetical protein CWC28_10730 [Pseudoalteromonas sp. S4492]